MIVQVVGCEPQAVVTAARLNKDLGVDSLSIVEIAEALGQAFDIYIDDETVNEMVTVQDAINAVVHHAGGIKGTSRPATAAALMASRREARPLPDEEIERRKRTAWKFAGWFAAAGLALGAVLGIGGAALINASGLKDVTRPATPTATATTAKPTTEPTATAPTITAAPKPTLEAANTAISPGERLKLTGAFPELDEGAILQVQVKDKGGEWDDFPVTTRTGADGKFTTVIFTTRTGERQIRMLHKATDTATPAVTITVG